MFRIFCCFLLLYAVSWCQRDRLPPPSEIDTCLASDPVQTATTRPPFDVCRQGVTYHIKPIADYEIRGLVVSYHNSDSFLDIYHGLWGDKLNLRDLGLVWGHNALSGVYRDVKFHSRDFTLFFRTDSDAVLSQFRFDQISNNHLLAAEPDLVRSLRQIGRGDQVALRGVLCEYSHPGGKRSTSLTRKDQGNGACETLFVDSVAVVREANSHWRLLMNMSSLMLKLMLPLLAWQVWVAFKPRKEDVPWTLPEYGPAPLPRPVQEPA